MDLNRVFYRDDRGGERQHNTRDLHLSARGVYVDETMITIIIMPIRKKNFKSTTT